MTICEFAIARYVHVLRRKPELEDYEERFLVMIGPTMQALEERERMRDALQATRRR